MQLHLQHALLQCAATNPAVTQALLSSPVRTPGAQTLRSCGSALRMDPPAGLSFGAGTRPGLGLGSGMGLDDRNMALSSSSVGASSLACGEGRVPSEGGETLTGVACPACEPACPGRRTPAACEAPAAPGSYEPCQPTLPQECSWK